MQKEEGRNPKTIEVKGMNKLSKSYIQRFFNHAGPVEQVSKVEDLVVVKFKNSGSVAKALRFNSRVIDKQPIKIRTLNYAEPTEDRSVTWEHLKREETLNNERIDQMIASRDFDLPFLWSSLVKIISKLADHKLRWLIHDIFFIKVSQVIHFHAFRINERSQYLEIAMKELLINDNRKGYTYSQSSERTQMLEFMCVPPYDLSDEANFQSMLANVDSKLKFKFRELFKAADGDRLHEIYMLFHVYSMHVPIGESIFSCSNHSADQDQFCVVSQELVTDMSVIVCLQDIKENKKRSQYRKIDHHHPSKQIQVISDGVSEKYIEQSRYQIFRRQFDGNYCNSCCVDIFFHFRLYLAPNHLMIRLYESGKQNYIKLALDLRLEQCQTETMGAIDYGRYCRWTDGVFQEIVQFGFRRHNIVLGEWKNMEEVEHVVINFIRHVVRVQENENEGKEVSIIFIVSNPGSEQAARLHKVCSQLFNKLPEIAALCEFLSIEITDPQKFEKQKCSNFLQQFVDQQKGTFSIQIARAHAKRLIQESPGRFQGIASAEQFATQVIWKLEQQKSKRQARTVIKSQIYQVKSKQLQ